jgi:hypothetical protein
MAIRIKILDYRSADTDEADPKPFSGLPNFRDSIG